MLSGVIPALPTFFKADYSYDAATMRRHIDRLIAYNVHGLFLLGGVGEFLHLKTSERRAIAVDVIGHVAGRTPVIVGAGSSSTLEAVELTQHAAGADKKPTARAGRRKRGSAAAGAASRPSSTEWSVAWACR